MLVSFFYFIWTATENTKRTLYYGVFMERITERSGSVRAHQNFLPTCYAKNLTLNAHK